MTLRGMVFALFWCALLAAAVVATAGRVAVHDSSRASWLARGADQPTTIVGEDEAGTVTRERNEPVRTAIAAFGRSAGVAHDLALGLHLTLALATFFLLVGESGASAGWAASATAAAALLLHALARTGHPSWLFLGAFLPWIASLRMLVGEPRAGRTVGAALHLAAVFATSHLWSRGALVVLVGATIAFAARSARHTAAFVALAALGGVLWITEAALSPPPPPEAVTLGAVPFAFTGRRLAELFGGVELGVLGVFVAAALSGLVLEPRLRASGLLALALAWASLGPHTPAIPALGRPPALRLFEWIPGGSEVELPILCGVAAAAILVALGARFLSTAVPRAVGVAAAVALAVLAWTAVPPAPAARLSVAAPAGIVASDDRVLVRPLAFATVERVLAGRPMVRPANLEPDALVALAELLPERPNLLWTERLYETLETLAVDTILLEQAAAPLPPFLVREERAPDRLRIDAEARRVRYAELEPVADERWVASASGSAAGAEPARAHDRRPDTRWGTGEAQAPGQFFALDLGRAVEGVTRVVLDVGVFESDRARALSVELSSDGAIWREVAREPRPPLGETRLAIDFAPQSARAIRLVQLGRDRVLDWSIAEIAVWRTP